MDWYYSFLILMIDKNHELKFKDLKNNTILI